MKSYFFCLLLLLSCSSNEIQNIYTVTSRNGVNIRSSNNINSKVVVSIPYEDYVVVIKKQSERYQISGLFGSWVQVKYGDYKGWIFDAFLQPLSFQFPGKRFTSFVGQSDYFPDLRFENKDEVLFKWGTVGSEGFRKGKYTIKGDTIEITMIYTEYYQEDINTQKKVWVKKPINETTKYVFGLYYDPFYQTYSLGMRDNTEHNTIWYCRIGVKYKTLKRVE